MALTTEIHIPASPNRTFANMLFFLVSSLAHNAALPGPWNVVITLGRDGDLTPASPEFAWSRNFPVTFRRADPALWNSCLAEAARRKVPDYIYNATILQQFTQPFTADTVIFMDADTVVLRPLRELIMAVHAGNLLAAKPAWKPPPTNLDAIIARAGLRYDGPPMTYSGYGWVLVEPRFGPPYYNGGFIVCPRQIANLLQRQLPADFAFVAKHYPGHYIWQVANCLTIIRMGIACLDIDERYNMGIGEAVPSILPGPEGALLDALGEEQVRDARVIHYCTRGPHFVRNTTMADDAALRAFCAASTLTQGERMLQDAFLPFVDAWERRMSGPA